MRLAIIGWDGADIDVVRRLPLEVKEMGSLSQIGTYGNSAASWTSFTTGLPPEAHGLLDWRAPFDASRLAQWRMWHEGGRWGVMNVPFTWPPEPLNGFIVPGIPCPVDRVDSYPEGLGRLLELMGYVVHPAYLWPCDRPPEVGGRELLDRCIAAAARRARCAALASELYGVDVLFVVFSLLDVVQHWLYRDRAAVAEAYLAADRLTVRLLDRLEPMGWSILSDHGFTARDLGGYTGDHRPGGIWVTDTDLRPRDLEEAHDMIVNLISRGG